jgi:hypothetical protein
MYGPPLDCKQKPTDKLLVSLDGHNRIVGPLNGFGF